MVSSLFGQYAHGLAEISHARHLVAGLFYLFMLSGCTWITGAFLRERQHRMTL